MVPSYQGTSAYLLMTKYNHYLGQGGDGQNKIAILDPNATQTDPVTGATVMKEVLTILGPTPESGGGVKEWCINTAVVDPFTKSILANNEDGKLYRWDLTTNTLSQIVVLTAGLGEAYTSTVIGAGRPGLCDQQRHTFRGGSMSDPRLTVGPDGCVVVQTGFAPAAAKR